MSARRGYRLAPLAVRDLEEIWLYSFTNWSIEQADQYHAGIVQALEGLASGREAGRPVDIREGYFKHPAGSHFIYYRVTGGTIDVIRVLHQRMDAGRHF